MSFHNKEFLWRYIFQPEYWDKYGVTIYHPAKSDSSGKGPVMIRGLLVSEISLEFGVSYEANSSMLEVAGKLGGAAAEKLGGSGGSAIAKDAWRSGKEMLGIHGMNVADSVRFFQGVRGPGFTIDVFFMQDAMDATSYNKAIEDSLRLTNSADPSRLAGGGIGVNLLSPLNASPDANITDPMSQVNQDNTCMISIGKSLRLTHMLCDNFVYHPSTQQRPQGGPMYLKATYTFSPGRAMTFEEVRKWFTFLQQ